MTDSSPVPSLRRRIGRFALNLFIALLNLYGAGVALLLVMKLLVGERFVLVAVFNSFMPFVLLPALFLLPIGMIARRRDVMAVMLPGVLAFLLLYGGLFIPRTVSPPDDAPIVSILTYNIHAERRNLDPIVAIIHEADADIVAIQEVSDEAAARFEREFAEAYPYRALHPNPQATAGQGVLSRYPILTDDYWRNPLLPGVLSLGHQRVILDIDGTEVVLHNEHPVHPGMAGALFDDSYRSGEVDDLLQRARTVDGPLLLAGDFNMTDQSDDYARVAARYHDSFRAVGFGLGPTFPDAHFLGSSTVARMVQAVIFSPFLRLDYVFHNDDFIAIEARVWSSSGGSDHRPLFVRLALTGN